MFPTFLGHLNVEAADALLTHTFKNTIVCPIPRQSAELIGCAIILPLCEMGKKVPPCQEDCTGKNIKYYKYFVCSIFLMIFFDNTTEDLVNKVLQHF